MRKWFLFGFCVFMFTVNLFATFDNYNHWDVVWALMASGFGALAVLELRRIQYHEDIGEE